MRMTAHATAKVKEFIDHLDNLPDVDITDPKVYRQFAERITAGTRPEEERISREQARNLGRAFTKAIP